MITKQKTDTLLCIEIRLPLIAQQLFSQTVYPVPAYHWKQQHRVVKTIFTCESASYSVY